MPNTIFYKATTERTSALTSQDPEELSFFTQGMGLNIHIIIWYQKGKVKPIEALKEVVNEAIVSHEDINAWDLSCKLTEKMASDNVVDHPRDSKYQKFLLCQTDTTLDKNLKIFKNTRYTD